MCSGMPLPFRGQSATLAHSPAAAATELREWAALKAECALAAFPPVGQPVTALTSFSIRLYCPSALFVLINQAGN